MAKSGGSSSERKKGGIHIDEVGLAMFTRSVEESIKLPKSDRLGNKELAQEFEVSERTFTRKVAIVKAAMDELKSLEEKLSPREAPAPAKKEAPKVPGPLSRTVLHPHEETALATTKREEYGVIKTPERNPLDGLSDGQISQAGIAVGIVFGGGLAKMGKAISETHRPLGDRAMEMAQGSNAVATTILGVFESLRAFGVIGGESTGRRTKIIDGTLVEVAE